MCRGGLDGKVEEAMVTNGVELNLDLLARSLRLTASLAPSSPVNS